MARTQVPLGDGADDPERVVRVGDLEIYPAGLSLRMAGVKAALPLREFEVLLVLAENAGRVIPFQALLDHAWGKGFTDNSGTLKTHVNRLRRRIKAALGVDYIRTVRGLGYSLDPELARDARQVPRALPLDAEVVLGARGGVRDRQAHSFPEPGGERTQDDTTRRSG